MSGRADTDRSLSLGCTLPYSADPGALRAFAQAAEEIGYDYLATSEHILSDDRRSSGPSYECLTLLAFLSAATARIELSTAMLLLPLRPVALAAKQAAQVDALSGHRLRLGVAVGWNTTETSAHGIVPAVRGELLEEQVEAMRLLWAGGVVHYEGQHVGLPGVALDPRPARRIPVWMGGGTARSRGRPGPRALSRIARLADGFTMSAMLANQVEPGVRLIAELLDLVSSSGRSRGEFGIEARLVTRPALADTWQETARRWADGGATRLTVAERGGGDLDATIRLIDSVYTAVRSGNAARCGMPPV